MNARFVFNNCTVQIHVHQGVKDKIEVAATEKDSTPRQRPSQFLLEDSVVLADAGGSRLPVLFG